MMGADILYRWSVMVLSAAWSYTLSRPMGLRGLGGVTAKLFHPVVCTACTLVILGTWQEKHNLLVGLVSSSLALQGFGS